MLSVFVSAVMSMICGADATQGLNNPFFAFKNSMETAGPTSVEEQTKILSDIGYDGFDNRDLEGLKDELEALDRHGLKLFTVYLTVRIDDGETPFNQLLAKSLPLLKGRETVLWCNTHSKKFP